MNAPQKSLDEYIKNHAVSNERLLDSGLATICKNRLNTIEYTEAINKIFNQKRKNAFFADEIVNIQKCFSMKGIKVIFLKGLPLAEDIYQVSYIRQSGDIDILIQYDEIVKSLEALELAGFYIDDKYGAVQNGVTIAGISYKKYIDEFGKNRMHFPELKKKIVKEGKVYCIELDCHVCIYPELHDYKEAMKECFDRSMIQVFHGTNINILSLYHRLLHLITHFVLDSYQMNMRWIITGWYSAQHSVKVNLLHDIALLCYKYYYSIVWNDFLKVAKKYNQTYKVYFVMWILGEIYKIKPKEKIEKCTEENKSFIDIVLESCMNVSVLDVIFEDQYKLMEKLFCKFPYNGVSYREKNLIRFFINAPSNRLIESSSTQTLTTHKVDCYADGIFRIIGESIFIKINIRKQKKWGPYFPEIIYMLGDGNLISNYQCITPLFRYIVDEKNGSYEEKLFVGLREYREPYVSCFYYDENVLSYELYFTQDMLPIQYDKDIFFNIEIDERDKNGDSLRSYNDCKKGFNITNYTRLYYNK